MSDSPDPSTLPDESELLAPLARASSSAVGEILGLLAHDLRNPLAALSSNVGFLNMMRKDMDEDAGEAVDDLQLSIEALSRIIDSLELVSTELREVVPPQPRPETAQAMLQPGLGQLERAAASHGVGLEVEMGDLAGCRINVSAIPFSRALTALIHNALTVAPSRSKVLVTLAKQGNELLFCVKDDGPALAKELALAALSATGQSSIKTASQGRYSRGLGLYVANRAAALGGGRLDVAEAESGSLIYLRAPALE